jgi:hypothetical protein
VLGDLAEGDLLLFEVGLAREGLGLCHRGLLGEFVLSKQVCTGRMSEV